MSVGVSGSIRQEFDVDEATEFVTTILEAEHVDPDSTISVAFLSVNEMATLNEEHMGKSGPTDVLSFPIEDASPGSPPLREVGGPPLDLGDIFICADIVEEHAREYGVLFTDELHLMIVHGVLHILGWDHQTDQEAEAMEAREVNHLASIGRARR